MAAIQLTDAAKTNDMSYLKSIFLCFILAFPGLIFPQGKQSFDLQQLTDSFSSDRKNLQQESILGNTDKWLYVGGENIWFSAYCINKFSHRLERGTNTIFVDLVSDKDSVVSQLLLNNLYFKISGNLAIPINLPEGDYWLRAYTIKMLKQDTAAIFVKHLYILNGSTPNPVPHTHAQLPADGVDRPQITFFPEGGSVIGETQQLMAFRVNDRNGNPICDSAYVSNDLDSILCRLKTTGDGLGKVSIYMEPGGEYNLHMKSADNKYSIFPIPSPDPFGARVSVLSETDSSFRLMVQLGDSLLKENPATYILGVCLGDAVFATSGEGQYQAEIPKRSMPTGECSILLFDKQHDLLSERIIYIRQNQVAVALKTDKENYGPREKVRLDIAVKDKNDQPLPALFSVTVTDDQFVKPGDDSEEAGVNDEDLEMLAKKNYANEGKSRSPDLVDGTDNNYTGIKGKLLDNKGRILKDQIVTLFSNDNALFFGTDTVRENGRFFIPLPDYTDSSGFVLQVTNLKGAARDADIELDSFRFPVFKTPVGLKRKWSLSESNHVKTFKIQYLDSIIYGRGKGWLKEVTVRAVRKKESPFDENKRVSMFSKIVNLDMISRGGVNSVGNAILMTPGVQLVGGHMTIRGGIRPGMGSGSENEPLLVIDGTIITPPRDLQENTLKVSLSGSPLVDYLNQVPGSSIDFIEVLAGPEAAIYGVNSGNGAIVIHTRNDSRRMTDPTIGVKKFRTKGYLAATTFPLPDYDNPEIRGKSYPDQRSTIYWNGAVFTDSGGKGSVGFFSSDGPTSYTATIRGITLRGEIIYRKITILRK